MDAKFSMFGTSHLIALLIILILVGLMIGFRKQLIKIKQPIFILFALLLLFASLWEQGILIYHHEWSISKDLPLHLCRTTIILMIIMLFNKSYRLFEVVYFTGLVGALVALLTPDLAHDFPHWTFTMYFIKHSLMIFTVLAMVMLQGYKPTFKSVIKTLLYLNAFLVVVYLINLLTGGNYLYVSHKPLNPTAIDYLGPYPWYILSFEGLAISLFVLFYLPFRKSNDNEKNQHISL